MCNYIQKKKSKQTLTSRSLDKQSLNCEIMIVFYISCLYKLKSRKWLHLHKKTESTTLCSWMQTNIREERDASSALPTKMIADRKKMLYSTRV
jgi:hypothetical protein